MSKPYEAAISLSSTRARELLGVLLALADDLLAEGGGVELSLSTFFASISPSTP